jgi:hypothetical protein
MYQQSANAACNKRIIYKMEHCKRRIIHIHPLQMSLYQACRHVCSVTDLGFRCRRAEHLLLLLDTRKTSFIAKKIEESERGLHCYASKGMNTFFYP